MEAIVDTHSAYFQFDNQKTIKQAATVLALHVTTLESMRCVVVFKIISVVFTDMSGTYGPVSKFKFMSVYLK